MTDANLMDAECIHGFVWYDCYWCFVDAPSELSFAQMHNYD